MMDWGLLVLWVAGAIALLLAFVSSRENHEDFVNSQGSIGAATQYWFNQSSRVVYVNPPAGASAYPYVSFRTHAPVEAAGAILIKDLSVATWFDNTQVALKTLLDLTHNGAFGSVAVYAIELK